MCLGDGVRGLRKAWLTLASPGKPYASLDFSLKLLSVPREAGALQRPTEVCRK